MSPTIVDRSGVLTLELREFIERRVWFAMSRFASRIERIGLVLEDANGPRGGVDKCCRLTVKLRGAQDVVVSDQDADIATSAARVAERGARAVSRAIERTQRGLRPRTRSEDFDILRD